MTGDFTPADVPHPDEQLTQEEHAANVAAQAKADERAAKIAAAMRDPVTMNSLGLRNGMQPEEIEELVAKRIGV